jgi:hypothetical protein
VMVLLAAVRVPLVVMVPVAERDPVVTFPAARLASVAVEVLVRVPKVPEPAVSTLATSVWKLAASAERKEVKRPPVVVVPVIVELAAVMPWVTLSAVAVALPRLEEAAERRPLVVRVAVAVMAPAVILGAVREEIFKEEMVAVAIVVVASAVFPVAVSD